MQSSGNGDGDGMSLIGCQKNEWVGGCARVRVHVCARRLAGARGADEANEAAAALGTRHGLALADSEAEGKKGGMELFGGDYDIFAVASIGGDGEGGRKRLGEGLDERGTVRRKWHAGWELPQPAD